jgi:hypothetical protein
MRRFWILVAVLVLILPVVLCAQEHKLSQSAPIASGQPGDSESGQPTAGNVQRHPSVGAPSMEIGVDHVRSLDSDEVTTELPPQPQQPRPDPKALAKLAKQKRSEEAHKAYRDTMENMYPGWYY